ncbi:nucleotide-binding protein [Burkholderia sp. Ac-20379]|uniref:nucleotide-binding protein n=1 Tax=Burkholderia sp. Ac-20379 TaxID=2703900 RepID=UPI001DB970E6|nr:nucleotide-binding protein [Burkholderia sp. Ac-20379]
MGRITKVEHRADGYYLHFERDHRVDPIPQDKLLAMAAALDIRTPTRSFGDLGSSHWSVKHVDLYRVLERHGLFRSAALPREALLTGGVGEAAGFPDREPQYFTAATVRPGEDAATQQITGGGMLAMPAAQPSAGAIAAKQPSSLAGAAARDMVVRLAASPDALPQPPGGFIRTAAQAAAARADAAPVVPPPATAAARTRVFIVHGHNVAVREEVARFVQGLGLEAVILHEQPNQGRTILAKFQDEAARAAFAIVLLTGDDRGGIEAGDRAQYQLRARQNVVFEFGFFAGSLGLPHVCALVDGPLEKPSDIDGLVYISRAGDWKLQLVKEMHTSGLPVDVTSLLR